MDHIVYGMVDKVCTMSPDGRGFESRPGHFFFWGVDQPTQIFGRIQKSDFLYSARFLTPTTKFVGLDYVCTLKT